MHAMHNSNVSTGRIVCGIYSGIAPDSGLILVILLNLSLMKSQLRIKSGNIKISVSSLKRVISVNTFITGLRLNT